MSDPRKQHAAAAPPGEAPHGPAAGVPAGAHPASIRLEFFSDAVFAFASTLLVVALEVPHTYPELVENLWGFLAFGLSFVALALIWSSHHAFFRRFPLADRATIALNAVLLFVVLFYVYPLKFMTVSLFDVVLGLHPERRGVMFRGEDDVAGMFMVYSLGFVAVFGVFSLLYRHAARQAVALGLSPVQLHEARALQRNYLILAAVGVLSIATAAAGIGVRYGVPGYVYGLIGPLAWWHGSWSERRAPRPSA
jgi:hypothetical protein